MPRMGARPDHATRIVVTIGPASTSRAVGADLLRAGLDVARLRLSPGDFDTHALVLADCRAYVSAQEAIAGAFLDSDRWPRMSILNTARTGCFSSDRAIRECAESIWRVAPVEVP